jgi:hypothetical protein
MKAALITMGVVLGLIVMFGISYAGAYNTANRLETGVKAAWTSNQNVLAQYSNKIAEAAQIPAMQRDDLKDVVTAALDARYGADGSKAMFQFIKEQNPTIDSTVYTQLQRMMEAGRDDFRLAQDKLIDQKRVYETKLGSLWTGTMMGVAGFPRVPLDTYNIVINNRTEDAFKTGKEEAIKLR